MQKSKRLVVIFLAISMISPLLAADSDNKSTDQDKKELKRMAHRLRIPTEQLENARSALQEATDLAGTMDPFPVSKINMIISEWKSLHPSKVESASEYFILALQLQALEAVDERSYSQANSRATSILRTLASVNYNKAKEILSTWPYPPESFGEAAIQSYDRMQTSVMQSILQQMAKEDPDALKEQSIDYDAASPSDLLPIAQNLINTGNRDKAVELIDRVIERLPDNPNNPTSLAQSIAWTPLLRYMDNEQVLKLMNQIAPTIEQTPQANALSMTLNKGDSELQLSPNEIAFAAILRGLTSRPRFLNEVLDKFPEFEAKFEDLGGIDDYLSNGSYLRESIQSQATIGSRSLSSILGYDLNDPQELFDKLKEKAADDPSWVKQELRKSIEDPQNISLLTNIASRAAREYPELAEIALEMAEEYLPRIDDPQKRFSALQALINAYRNLDGEVDEALFRKGYILIDQIKVSPPQIPNISNLPPELAAAMSSAINMNTDRLEAYLAAELARQDYEKAIDYVHGMVPGPSQLECLIQISRALRQNNF